MIFYLYALENAFDSFQGPCLLTKQTVLQRKKKGIRFLGIAKSSQFQSQVLLLRVLQGMIITLKLYRKNNNKNQIGRYI